MASQLEAIYDALEARVISVDGRAIPVRGLSNPPGSLTSGLLPVRILHPYDSRAEGRTFHFRGMGASQVKGTWVITDWCAFAPIASVPPLRQLVKYMVAYTEMMKTFRKAGGETNAAITAMLQQWEPKAGVSEWPIGSGDYYHGIQVVFEVEELVS